LFIVGELSLGSSYLPTLYLSIHCCKVFFSQAHPHVVDAGEGDFVILWHCSLPFHFVVGGAQFLVEREGLDEAVQSFVKALLMSITLAEVIERSDVPFEVSKLLTDVQGLLQIVLRLLLLIQFYVD
jgi:hypothetical protein